MLTYKEFEVLRGIMKLSGSSDAAGSIYAGTRYRVFKSADEVRELYGSLLVKGYADSNGVTKAGYEEIEPLRVENAVILAAGGADVSAK